MAIDASMCLYQFLIAVTRADGAHLTDADGDTTRSPDCHVMLRATSLATVVRGSLFQLLIAHSNQLCDYSVGWQNFTQFMPAKLKRESTF